MQNGVQQLGPVGNTPGSKKIMFPTLGSTRIIILTTWSGQAQEGESYSIFQVVKSEAVTNLVSLSAIMMGRLKMTVNEALEQYSSFGNAVFGHPRWMHERSKLYWPRSKYGSRRVKRAILEAIRSGLRREKDGNYEIMQEKFASNEHQCRTLVNPYPLSNPG